MSRADKENQLTCPFFLRDRGNGQIYCEICTFKFPDKESRRAWVYKYCAHPSQYTACPLGQLLQDHYERKYKKFKEGGENIEH